MKLHQLKKGNRFKLQGHGYVVTEKYLDCTICRDVKTRQEFCFIGNYDVR